MAARQVVITKNTTKKYRVPKGTKSTSTSTYKCPVCGSTTAIKRG